MFSKISSDSKWTMLAGRFILLLALPFLLGLYAFPHTQYVDGSLLSTPTGYKNAAEIMSYTFSAADSGLVLGRSVGSVFPLSNYLDFQPFVSHDRMQLCFQDNGSTITLPNGSQFAPDMEWEIHINNDPAIMLNQSSFACSDVPPRGPVVYAWKALISTDISRDSFNGTIVFNPATLTYPRMQVNFGLLQGIAMIPVFYLLVWYPIAGIWKKLREGMMEQ